MFQSAQKSVLAPSWIFGELLFFSSLVNILLPLCQGRSRSILAGDHIFEATVFFRLSFKIGFWFFDHFFAHFVKLPTAVQQIPVSLRYILVGNGVHCTFLDVVVEYLLEFSHDVRHPMSHRRTGALLHTPRFHLINLFVEGVHECFSKPFDIEILHDILCGLKHFTNFNFKNS